MIILFKMCGCGMHSLSSILLLAAWGPDKMFVNNKSIVNGGIIAQACPSQAYQYKPICISVWRGDIAEYGLCARGLGGFSPPPKLFYFL